MAIRAAIGILAVVAGTAIGQRDTGGTVAPRGPAQPDGDVVTISQVSEPLELTTLVELAVTWLDINVAIDPGLSGQVVFTQPVRVPKDELLGLIGSLLEQQGYSIYLDERTNFYNVVSSDNVPVSFEGPLASTRIIRTPNVRPTALRAAIEEQLGTGNRVTYMDDLGILIVSGSPGRIDVLERFVNRILEERSALELTRIELQHVSAPVARARLLELVSAPVAEFAEAERLRDIFGVGGTGGQGQVGNRDLNPGGAGVQQQEQIALDNVGDRIIVATNGNALLFRGRADELVEFQKLVSIIDVLPGLTEVRYFTGTSTEGIARYASQQGLGEVVMMTMEGQQSGGSRGVSSGGQVGGQDVENLGARVMGGPRIVADIYGQHIVYYGTESQQDQMRIIVNNFEPEQDLVVVQAYKLFHADALTMSETINALLTNQVQTGDAPLLPGGGDPNRPDQGQGPIRDPNAQPAGEGIIFPGGEDVFVTPDEANNQLMVKAPQKQQPEFERLIRQMDLRRPQVFLDVQIVAVTWSKDTQFGVEYQGIGSNGGFNTNVGLSEAGASFLDPKSVATGLLGLTAALVDTNDVPIIINAVKDTLKGRIISSPKLLVDDNEEGEIESVQSVAIATVNQGQNSDQVSFGGFEDAGTTLIVTPSISEGGQVRLKYEITLSDFVGQGTGGLPPDKQKNFVRSDAVTVPSDMTVIVGGIQVKDTALAKVRVPLLGDIPLVGLLFGSTRDEVMESSLYVFITPRVLRDPSPVDYRLLTRGPQATVKIDDGLPKLEPIMIPIVAPTKAEAGI